MDDEHGYHEQDDDGDGDNFDDHDDDQMMVLMSRMIILIMFNNTINNLLKIFYLKYTYFLIAITFLQTFPIFQLYIHRCPKQRSMRLFMMNLFTRYSW